MAGAGMAMLAVAACAVLLVYLERFETSRRFLRVLPFAIALPYLGNSAGWIFTEMGRQPWIVFGLQKTADAVSPTVTAGEVLFSLVVFTLLYGALMVADVYLLAKFARGDSAPPDTREAALGDVAAEAR
jgi:cytochrome d ubiquinol oxidase subunit I